MNRPLYLLLGLIASQGALAANLDYSYAGIEYVVESVDDYNCTQSGLTIDGTIELASKWYALGSFTDVSGGSCGSSTFKFGGGLHTGFSNNFDLYASLSFADTSVDYGQSDAGLVIAGGFRGNLDHQFEGVVEVARYTAFDGNTTLTGGLIYALQAPFYVTGDITIGSEGTAYSLGVRYDF